MEKSPAMRYDEQQCSRSISPMVDAYYSLVTLREENEQHSSLLDKMSKCRGTEGRPPALPPRAKETRQDESND